MERCTLALVRTMPDDRTKTFFDERAAGYYQRNYVEPRNRHARNLALRRALTLSLFPPGNGPILDLGCGPGALTIPLLERKRSVVSIDLSREMTERTRDEGQRRGLQPRLAVANALALPFADNSFDVVVSTGVLEYVPDLERALQEIVRVLSPTGVAIVTMSLPRRVERFVMRQLAAARGQASQATQYIYDAARFDQMVEASGLTIDARRCCGFAPFPLDAVLPSSVSWIDAKFDQSLNRSAFARRHAKTYVVRASLA